MEVRTKIDYKPTVDEMITEIIWDPDKLAEFFFKMFVDYNWDEAFTAHKISAYLNDCDDFWRHMLISKLKTMLEIIKQKEN